MSSPSTPRTPREEARIRELVGERDAVIAAEFGVSESTIRRARERLGLPPQPSTPGRGQRTASLLFRLEPERLEQLTAEAEAAGMSRQDLVYARVFGRPASWEMVDHPELGRVTRDVAMDHDRKAALAAESTG